MRRPDWHPPVPRRPRCPGRRGARPSAAGPVPETGSHASPARAWQDRIVYVLIPHKFFDGDPSNDGMRDRYELPTPASEGGFLGGT